MIDGWPHCPATPERLEIIERPGVFASKEEIEEFHDKIDERQQYAAMRLSQDTRKGCARYRCPAKEGSIGCPHVEGTVDAAVSLGQPTIQNPPDLEATPIKLCQQGSVTIHKEAYGKLDQPHYWGSRIWAKIYGLRTHVEGFFGSLKNPSTEAIGRGHHRLVGLANASIVAAVGSAACNIRLLRKNAEELRDLGYGHILINEDQEDFGIKLLTEDEANEIDARHAGAAAQSIESIESGEPQAA